MEKLWAIKKEFEQQYVNKEPYSNYVNSCSTSNLGLVQKFTSEEISLREGETLEDLCLTVSLKEKPPKDLELPKEYKGVRVFYDFGSVRFY